MTIETNQMELRHLRYFVVVAEEQNLRRAAERLHVAPPSLSVQIQNLETEIGATLFAREGRGIQLNESGRVFLTHARQILADAKRGVAQARRAAEGEIGNVSVGYNMAAGFRVFPRIVAAFRRKRPTVHLTFHDLKISEQIERVRHGELDVGFVWLPVPTDGLDVQELVREPLVAVVPADHRLASASEVSIEDLSEEPLVVVSRALAPETYYETEQVFVRAGKAMNVAYELANSLSIINFVAMGAGCSLLPDYVRRISVDGAVYRPLMPPGVVRTLGMIKGRDKGGLAELFYHFTIDHLEKIGDHNVG
jgi:DNA-binding transcriptional LysR family regulator